MGECGVEDGGRGDGGDAAGSMTSFSLALELCEIRLCLLEGSLESWPAVSGSSSSCVTCSNASESSGEAAKRFSERVRTVWALVPPSIVSPLADLPSFRANLGDCSSRGVLSLACASMPSRYI